MPQPYKRRTGETVRTGPDILLQNEALAVEIAFIALQWNQLELYLTQIFCASLLEYEQKAFDIYHSLLDRGLRKSVLLCAGKGIISKDLTDRINKLYTEVRRVAEARNKVVHGLWAISDLTPNERPFALLCEERTLSEHFSGYCQRAVSELWKMTAEMDGSKPGNEIAVLAADNVAESYPHIQKY